MDMEKNLRAVNQFNQDFELRQAQEKERRSKERLFRLIEKRFKTTFVGALSTFENEFGSKWGAGKDRDDLTDEEYENRNIWEFVRNDILNKGNKQLRAALSELSDYTVIRNDYVTNLIIKDKKEGQDG